MYSIVYYVNNFIGTEVGVIGGMRDGVVYGFAPNLPQTVVEHYVEVPGGEDGRDGKMFQSQYWIQTKVLSFN